MPYRRVSGHGDDEGSRDDWVPEVAVEDGETAESDRLRFKNIVWAVILLSMPLCLFF